MEELHLDRLRICPPYIGPVIYYQYSQQKLEWQLENQKIKPSDLYRIVITCGYPCDKKELWSVNTMIEHAVSLFYRESLFEMLQYLLQYASEQHKHTIFNSLVMKHGLFGPVNEIRLLGSLKLFFQSCQLDWSNRKFGHIHNPMYTFEELLKELQGIRVRIDNSHMYGHIYGTSTNLIVARTIIQAIQETKQEVKSTLYTLILINQTKGPYLHQNIVQIIASYMPLYKSNNCPNEMLR